MHPGSIPGEASNIADRCLLGAALHAPAPFHRDERNVMDTEFSEERLKMVDGQLRTTDVTSLPVIDAFLEVPREAFVPAKLRPIAYIDEDLAIAPGRYLMEPSPLAKLIQLAHLGSSDVVLDVGCATGYASAVMSRIASSVIALESDEAIAETAARTLSELGYDNVAVLTAPLCDGYPDEAPYDAILIDGAVDTIPQALFDQLKDGGRLVAVEGTGNAGMAMIYLKEGGFVSGRRAFNCAIKPLPGFEREEAFEF